jgi:ribonuclease G
VTYTKEIYINVSIGSTRIAILENGALVELYIDIADHKRMVGNIYRGKIQNVIPGMQAAFIDIGHDINSFLPFSEIGNSDNVKNLSFSDDDDDDNGKSKHVKQKNNFDPEKDLKINDNIFVQVIKEPFSGKGPRVTTDISFAGSLLVLVPNQNYIGISKKISDKYERRRLREIIKRLALKNFGIILRTSAEGKNDSEIEEDLNKTLSEWEKLNAKNDQEIPYLAYKDAETPNQVIRDLLTDDTSKVYIDCKKTYNKIYTYLKQTNKKHLDKLSHYKKKGSIFQVNDIETQIQKSLKTKVWLKSGGHLAIEHTEAMVVIDVNSGRFIGNKKHEDNSLKVNLEAAREISKQLRLRDIGGLIVIDFIDLIKEENRKKVYYELRNNLKRDRAKVSLADFSNFGLLEMTRQRVRLDLLHTLSEDCPTCKGLGLIPSKDTILTSIECWLKTFKTKSRDRRFAIYLNPKVHDHFKETKHSELNGFMWKNWLLIELKIDENLAPHQFKVFSKRQKKFVTEEV